jgi:SAM-dependent methyltransferase
MKSIFPDPTFRDPAGTLVLEQNRAVRQIHPEARAAVRHFIDSAFYLRLVERGDMIGTTPEESPAGLRLVHPRIPIPTYPWEWTPSQWLAAGELTLKLCDEGLDEGWVLKDATPLNILFLGSRPVLVDVLSFERRDPAAFLWLAYGQYIRTFVLPLLVNRLLHWPLELSLFRRDGFEPADVYAAMGWSQRLSPAALWSVTMPTLLDRRKGAVPIPPSSPANNSDAALSLHILKRTLASLRKRTRSALPSPSASTWSDYVGKLTHYTPVESAQKQAWISSVLEELRPRNVLDIGANTGEYSALAVACGAEVVALERDAEAAERIVRMSRTQGLSIQTIHADFARPTPAAGWENGESSPLLSRLEGRFDLVLLLAVIHHLLLLDQIPLPAIVAVFHRLTRRYLVIEWVPATDPMYLSLMRGRHTLYGSLTRDDLLAACNGLFRPLRQQTIDNGRILFLFEKWESGPGDMLS